MPKYRFSSLRCVSTRYRIKSVYLKDACSTQHSATNSTHSNDLHCFLKLLWTAEAGWVLDAPPIPLVHESQTNACNPPPFNALLDKNKTVLKPKLATLMNACYSMEAPVSPKTHVNAKIWQLYFEKRNWFKPSRSKAVRLNGKLSCRQGAKNLKQSRCLN